MLESVSPYALLCASKPKPAPTIVTAYDLYSQSQQNQAQISPPQTPAPAAAQADTPAGQSTPNLPSSVPARRTHYIADIQARHSAAIRRAPMQNHPLT